jgi:hypothetical protein
MTRAFECILLYMRCWCAHADAADVLLLLFFCSNSIIVRMSPQRKLMRPKLKSVQYGRDWRRFCLCQGLSALISSLALSCVVYVIVLIEWGNCLVTNFMQHRRADQSLCKHGIAAL